MSERTVSVDLRLRPLRLAFVIDPHSRTQLIEAIHLCSIRWGGLFNCLIPAHRRRPQIWDRGSLRGPSASDIVQGYLNCFEPDYLVIHDPELGHRHDFEQGLIISRTSLDQHTAPGDVGYGISLRPVVDWLYTHELRFVHRRPYAALNVDREALPELLRACLFGHLIGETGDPSFAEPYNYIVRDLVDEEPKDPFVAYLSLDRMSPLSLGAVGSGLRRPSPVRILFVFDPSRASDVMYFWNLRAFGLRPIPIPTSHLDQAIEAYLTVARSSDVAQRAAAGTRLALFGMPTVEPAVMREVQARAHQAGLPLQPIPAIRLWDEDELLARRIRRHEVSVAKKSLYTTTVNDRIEFDLLEPDYELPLGGFSPRFANIVGLRDSSWGTDTAGVIPPDLGQMDQLLGVVGGTEVTSTAEGIIVRDRLRMRQVWTLPKSLAVFESWLGKRGIVTTLSEPGRIAREMVAQIEAVQVAGLIARPSLLNVINAATRANEPHGQTIARSRLLELPRTLRGRSSGYAGGTSQRPRTARGAARRS